MGSQMKNQSSSSSRLRFCALPSLELQASLKHLTWIFGILVSLIFGFPFHREKKISLLLNSEELFSVVDNRSKEVFNFIDMLRSTSTKTSEDSHAEWKVGIKKSYENLILVLLLNYLIKNPFFD